MCGRYGRTTRLSAFAHKLGLSLKHEPPDGPNYNAHPGVFQFLHATKRGEQPNACDPTFIRARWGYLPSWAKDMALSPINAKSEEAADKRMWRKAFHLRRCVIPADWWYEWKGPNGSKQPYAIRPAGATGFFFAGLWSVARSLPPQEMSAKATTFAILTTAPHSDIADIHHRMPIALTDEGAQRWIADGQETADLQQRLADGQFGAFESWPVSTKVNKPENNSPDVIERV